MQQVDPELLKEIEQWNEALKTDVINFVRRTIFILASLMELKTTWQLMPMN